ncbi:MAG: hypothetical protein PF795_04815 [Kiritimatiellae bacterium]|jgi:hypothetical protein|nr:hypothetical protein [Kiritimatiellia bacterium]
MRKFLKLMLLFSLINNVAFAATVLRDVTISAGYHSVLFNIGDRYEINFTTETDQQVEINPPDKAGWWYGSSSPITLGNCPGSPESQLFAYDVASNQLPGDAFIANADGNILCMSGDGPGSGGSGYFNYEMRLNGIAVIIPTSFHLITGQTIELEGFFQEYGTSSDTIVNGRFTVGDGTVLEFVDESGNILSSESDRTGETILARGKAPGNTYAQLSLDENETVTELSNGKVSNIFLESVEFHNDNDIKTDSGDTYTGSDWLDTHPFDGTISGENEKRQPVSYTSGEKITVSAKFKIDAYDASQIDTTDIKIRGTGPDGFKIGDPEEGITPNLVGTNLTIGATVSEGETKFADDKVKYYSNFDILWEISFDDGDTWIEVGSSDNMLYVTYMEPIVTPVHTLLHIGTVNADGEDDNGTIVSEIFKKFEELEVYKVNPTTGANLGPALRYWETLNPPGSVAGLLEDGEGTCEAWSTFFKLIIQTQGIMGSTTSILSVKMIGGVYMIDSGMIVKPENHGQGNNGENPPATNRFNNHAVILHGGVLYDPSYGIKKSGENQQIDWENEALLKIQYCIGYDENDDPIYQDHEIQEDEADLSAE